MILKKNTFDIGSRKLGLRNVRAHFITSARVYASWARIFARIFMKIWLVVKYYLMNIKIRASIEEIWPKYVAQAFLPPPLNRQLRTPPGLG